ncbi:MAG: hypothetical protein IPH12_07595 [Saprospirales bacterium]|nr:hypothetical protein [Saprospirales bacterium]MBK8920710.1 hypothetical protein [Saprospirales bacterium]
MDESQEILVKTVVCRNCKSPRLHKVTPNSIKEEYGPETIQYTLLQCKSCKTVVLEEVKCYKTDEIENIVCQTPQYYPEPSVNSIIPIENKLDAIPDQIYQIYILCAKSYNVKLKKGCLLYIYHTIETLCQHFGKPDASISLSTRLKKIRFTALKKQDVIDLAKITEAAGRYLEKGENDIKINTLQIMINKVKDILFLEFIQTKEADIAREEMPNLFQENDDNTEYKIENSDNEEEIKLKIGQLDS